MEKKSYFAEIKGVCEAAGPSLLGMEPRRRARRQPRSHIRRQHRVRSDRDESIPRRAGYATLVTPAFEANATACDEPPCTPGAALQRQLPQRERVIELVSS